MRGESHLGMAMSAGIITAGTCFLVLKSPDFSESIKNAATAFTGFMLDSGDMMPIIFVPIAIILFLIGAILPDIDTPYSMLGRFICLPFEHRTWTHAIWWPAALCVAGIWVRLLMWLGIGVFIHDFCDSFSASGLHWFYPIKNKNKHVLKLYHTGKGSEYAIVTISWVITILYILFIIQKVYHILDIAL